MDTTLTLEEVAHYPRPGTVGPRQITITPDGRAVAYLLAALGSLTQELWTYDLASGERRQITDAAGRVVPEEDLSLEEQLRRERGRVRERGVTGYQFARAGGDGPLVLLAPLEGALYVRHGAGPLELLAGSEGANAPRLSPDGAQVAFVRDGEIYVMTARGGLAHQLTEGAEDGLTNGLADYIAQEEMGRPDGYWWSPDSQRLAYVRADSRHIPVYPIMHQGRDTVSVEQHRYPFAGGPNVRVRLGVVAATGVGQPQTRWMDLGPDQDIYLARVDWRPDGTLTAQVQSRDQRTLRLVAFNEATGAATTLIEERGAPWLNLHDDLRLLKSGEMLWSSERDGYRHLYLYGAAGGEPRALTSGAWVVTDVAAVDEPRRIAYFHGTRDDVRQRHLYAVALDGGAVRRVTTGEGWRHAVVAPDAGLFVDAWSSLHVAPSVTLRRLDDSAPVAVLHDAATSAASLGLVAPELATFASRDGVELHAAVYLPPPAAGPGPYPLVVSVYGGPHVQRVADQWDLTVDLRAQYLAQQGFAVLKVDNRGSANRGLPFEAALAGEMGRVEVDDQVDGVRWLAQRAPIDTQRVGVYGWSYGGYLTCMLLMRASEVFAVGVAGAPVTHWDGYDTHYTERYMGHPGVNPDGYARAAVLAHVADLAGKLLLVHGLVDENVHFRHTARLLVALSAVQKDYDLVVFPEERHMPRAAQDLEYLERRVVGYLTRHL